MGWLKVFTCFGLVLFLLQCWESHHCRLSYTMFNLQNLCLFRSLRPWTWLWVCMLVMPSVTASKTIDARQALMTETRDWLSQELNIPASELRLSPLKAKLRVRTCQSGWEWQNFLAQSTVQARCAQPRVLFLIKWQRGFVPEPVAVTPEVKSSGSASAASAPPDPPHAAASRKALVMAQTLPRGSHLEPHMLQWLEIPSHLWANHHLDDMAVIQGAELTRDMRAGQILRKSDIRPSVMVKKGSLVTIHIGEVGKMTISAQLQALQDGRMGETINLKNPDSGRLLSGVVSGLNTVRNP